MKLFRFGLNLLAGGLVTALCGVIIAGVDPMPTIAWVKAAITSGVIATGAGLFIAATALIWSDPHA